MSAADVVFFSWIQADRVAMIEAWRVKSLVMQPLPMPAASLDLDAALSANPVAQPARTASAPYTSPLTVSKLEHYWDTVPQPASTPPQVLPPHSEELFLHTCVSTAHCPTGMYMQQCKSDMYILNTHVHAHPIYM